MACIASRGPAHLGLVRGRWTFGNALYPAGNYKGMANLKWTCKSPCTSRNYLIQVPLRPAKPYSQQEASHPFCMPSDRSPRTETEGPCRNSMCTSNDQ